MFYVTCILFYFTFLTFFYLHLLVLICSSFLFCFILQFYVVSFHALFPPCCLADVFSPASSAGPLPSLRFPALLLVHHITISSSLQRFNAQLRLPDHSGYGGRNLLRKSQYSSSWEPEISQIVILVERSSPCTVLWESIPLYDPGAYLITWVWVTCPLIQIRFPQFWTINEPLMWFISIACQSIRSTVF